MPPLARWGILRPLKERKSTVGTGVGAIRIPIRGLENSLHCSLFRQFCLILVSQAKPEVGTTIFTFPPKEEKEK